jgi:hypothetical protein
LYDDPHQPIGLSIGVSLGLSTKQAPSVSNFIQNAKAHPDDFGGQNCDALVNIKKRIIIK